MLFTEAFDFNRKTSLYVHVPFCRSKCSYCGFYSKPCNSSMTDRWFEKATAEISKTVEAMKGQRFYTAYIGGGNPGCLSVEQLETIAKLICTNGRPEEFTVEMNPESLTEEHFSLFDNFFTRISMGVQSLNPEALKFLGRNASFVQTILGVEKALELKKSTGAQVSFDLITCLPDWHDYLSDVRKIAGSYSPDHISVYALTLEEGTPLFKAQPALPDSDEQSDILMEIRDYLESSGYCQYEVSNYAKEGKISKHNSVYWDYRQYVGIGPSAASTGFVGNRVYRVESESSLENYCRLPEFGSYNVTELSNHEALEEFVMMGLRHFRGLDLNRLQTDFGKRLNNVPAGYSIADGFLVPDKNGILIADWAASEVLRSIDS